jgi:hypothetical protein
MKSLFSIYLLQMDYSIIMMYFYQQSLIVTIVKHEVKS